MQKRNQLRETQWSNKVKQKKNPISSGRFTKPFFSSRPGTSQSDKCLPSVAEVKQRPESLPASREARQRSASPKQRAKEQSEAEAKKNAELLEKEAKTQRVKQRADERVKEHLRQVKLEKSQLQAKQEELARKKIEDTQRSN